MAVTLSTRRLELALPLIAPLSALMDARAKVKGGDPSAMPALMNAMGDSGTTKAVRQLAAISAASDNELEQADKDSLFMAKLVADAAQRPYVDALGDALSLFGFVLGAYGVTPSYLSNDAAPAVDSTNQPPPTDTGPASPSAG